MLEKERHNLILKLVEERSIVSVGDLLDLLGASEATIRRDINALAERGEVKRIRGGAEAVRPRHQPHLVGMPFAMSQDVSVPQKRAIARAAAALIVPGESIIINGGEISRQETYDRTLEADRAFPLLVLDGSGRFADELAAAVTGVAADDARVTDIVRRGEVRIVPMDAGPDHLFAQLALFLT